MADQNKLEKQNEKNSQLLIEDDDSCKVYSATCRDVKPNKPHLSGLLSPKKTDFKNAKVLKNKKKNHDIIDIKCSDNKKRSFILNHFKKKTFADLKKQFFSTELEEGKAIRFIFQGRMLHDNEAVSGINFEKQKFIQCFVSVKLTSHRDYPIIQSLTSEPSEQIHRIRGFEMFKDVAVVDEEIIWRRYLFHKDYILNADLKTLDQDVLLHLEEIYLQEHNYFNKEAATFCKNNFSVKKSISKIISKNFLQNLKVFLFGFVFSYIGVFMHLCWSKRLENVELLFLGISLSTLLIYFYFSFEIFQII